MLKLQVERDPRTGVKVLSCYLLPQLSAHTQNGLWFSFYFFFVLEILLSKYSHLFLNLDFMHFAVSFSVVPIIICELNIRISSSTLLR